MNKPIIIRKSLNNLSVRTKLIDITVGLPFEGVYSKDPTNVTQIYIILRAVFDANCYFTLYRFSEWLIPLITWQYARNLDNNYITNFKPVNLDISVIDAIDCVC